MSRREFNRIHAAAIEEYAYVRYQSLPVWEIMALENQRVLHRKFRPPSIETRVKSAIAELRQGHVQ